MKKTSLLSRILAVAGIAVMAVYFFQQKESKNQALFYSACALIGLSYVITVISYLVNRNKKDLYELLLFTGILLLFYLASQLT